MYAVDEEIKFLTTCKIRVVILLLYSIILIEGIFPLENLKTGKNIKFKLQHLSQILALKLEEKVLL